jgi:hypothetical protein
LLRRAARRISGQFIHLAGFFEKIGVEWQTARVGDTSPPSSSSPRADEPEGAR